MPISKIANNRDQANLPQDLERYCQYTLELGLTKHGWWMLQKYR